MEGQCPMNCLLCCHRAGITLLSRALLGVRTHGLKGVLGSAVGGVVELEDVLRMRCCCLSLFP